MGKGGNFKAGVKRGQPQKLAGIAKEGRPGKTLPEPA